MINMTPRAGKKTPTSTNTSGKFVFPPEKKKPETGGLSTDELYQLLEKRNEELEELKEQFETLQ